MNTKEKTLIIIKNDAIRRNLVGKILQKFEDAGLTIEALNLVKPTVDQAERHYVDDPDWEQGVGEKLLSEYDDKMRVKQLFHTTDPVKLGRIVRSWSVKQLVNSKVVVGVVSGPAVIEKVKKLVGPRVPTDGDLSSIRGSFCSDTIKNSNARRRAIYNVVHRSSNREEAKREIGVWF
jgi:nucleoside-diphosphate kinase